MKKMNWGIIGTGTIVRKFAKGLLCLEDACVYAVAGHKRENTERFVSEIKSWGKDEPKLFDSYEQMLEDPAIDVVYIGLPNHLHAPCAKACILHGKHVLCEKPFAMNVKEAEEVIALAEERNVFCMEAMWTKFTPGILRAKEEIAKGTIGTVQYIHATFGFFMPKVDPEHRVFDLSKGGGAIMDVGIYPITFVVAMMGRVPDEVRSSVSIGKTGVDESNDLEFIYYGEQDTICHLSSSVRMETGTDAVVCGTKGKLYFPLHYAPEAIEVTQFEEETGQCITWNIETPYQSNGYEYEAMEVMNCIRAGKLQSEIHPLEDTRKVMRLMDHMRQGWGMEISFE